MKQYDDAFSIILAVVIVSTVGFVQEYKSEQAVAALKDLIAQRSAVRRDGREQEVLASQLVKGDIVLLAQGGKVPADLRIISASALKVNEAILTGEAQDVEKSEEPISKEDGFHLADRKNILNMGIYFLFLYFSSLFLFLSLSFFHQTKWQIE